MLGTRASTRAADPRLAKELRLAIAIRGGVSLAVWMGGAVREVVRLHDASRENFGTYARLLVACGYSEAKPGNGAMAPVPVTIDVLAGTSAGGLNASLLAAHLVYGVPFDDGIRDVWLRVGDLELLTRSPGERRPPSLLQGDTGFYLKMQEALQELAAGGVSVETVEQIDGVAADDAQRPTTEDAGQLQSLRLILTATRLTPRPDALRPDRGNPLVFEDSRAHFRFRYRRGVEVAGAQGPLSDFGLDDDSMRFTLDRLAYAARATSSFPGAFEPARVRVGNREHGAVDENSLPLDFHGVSSETLADTAQTEHEVELVDGGVLDNIPIDWALRAIAGAPAARPVDRWLLYLEPVPAEAKSLQTIDRTQRSVTRLTRLVAATMKARSQAQSMLRNAEQMRLADDEVYRLTALAGTGALSAGADAVIAEATIPPSRIEEYQAQIRDAEGLRWQRLLEDPMAVIGPDPLEVPPLGLPLNALDYAEVSTAFLAVLYAEQGAFAFPPASTLSELRETATSPLPVARAVTLVGDWLRVVERDSEIAIPPDLRRQLYRARFAAEVLVAISDRLLLHTVQDALEPWERSGRPKPLPGRSLPDGVEPAAIARVARAAFVAAVSWVSMPGSFSQPWHVWATSLASRPPDLPHPSPNPSGDSLAVMWRLLADLAVAVGTHATAPDGDGTDPFKALREAAVDPNDAHGRVLDVLSAAEVLLGPLRADPLAEPTEVRFAALSAGAEGPLDDRIFPGKHLERPSERVDQKLAGNQVHNFAAFVSARWRLNDWTWGRLDSARSLTEIIVEHRTDEFVGAEVRELFLGGGTLDADWSKFLTGEWKAFGIGDADDVQRDRVVAIVTARLQWEILAEEIPLVEALAAVDRSNNDLPPTKAALQGARDKVRPVEPAPGAAKPAQSDKRLSPQDIERALATFGAVGDESVKELTKKRGLRRSILRLGLVAWRAVYPSGQGWGAKIARVLLFLLEPIVWLPLLFDVAAPLATIAAGLLMFGAVAITVNHPVSIPADIIILTGSLVAVAVLWWQRATRPPTWKSISFAIVSVVVLYGVAVVVWATINDAHTDLTDVERALIASGCVLVATFLPLWWVLKFKGFWGKVRVVVTGIVTAAAGFGAAWVTAAVGSGNASKSWLVLLVLYVPLLVEALMLHHWFPRALLPAEPVANA